MSHPPPAAQQQLNSLPAAAFAAQQNGQRYMDTDVVGAGGPPLNAMHFQMANAKGGQQQQTYASAVAPTMVGPAPENNTIKLSKIIACEIKGTMNAFSVMGPNAASWKPVDGKHASIFGVEDSFDSPSTASEIGGDASGGGGGGGGSMLLNADLAAATNALRNVTITKATLLQSYNTFGVPLGVTVSCLPRCVFTCMPPEIVACANYS